MWTWKMNDGLLSQLERKMIVAMNKMQCYWWKLVLCVIGLFLRISMTTKKTQKKAKHRCRKYYRSEFRHKDMVSSIRRMTNWETRRTFLTDTITQSDAIILSLVIIGYLKISRRKVYTRNRYSTKNGAVTRMQRKVSCHQTSKFNHLKSIVPAISTVVRKILNNCSFSFPILYKGIYGSGNNLACSMVQRQLLLLAGDVELNPGPYSQGNASR